MQLFIQMVLYIGQLGLLNRTEFSEQQVFIVFLELVHRIKKFG